MEIPYWELTGIGLCLFFSAFFSAAETALTSLSKIKVHQLIEQYPKWGKPLQHWEKNHNGILTTILIGNNLSNISASALAADLAQYYFESNGIPIAIGIMTLLLLLSGEITPKTLARAYSTTIALPLMYIVLVFHIAFWPATWLLTHLIQLLLKMLGKHSKLGDDLTEEDIEFIVSLGRKEGAIDKDKENLLSSIFEFTDTTAKEIMVPRTDLVRISIDTPYEEVITKTLETGFSRIPVYEGNIDTIVGIFYTKNLIPPPQISEKEDFLKTRIKPPVFIPESKKISEVLKFFQKERIHLAIVVNEFGGTEGIVTMEDIIEELLGEIHDEFDSDEEKIKSIGGGTYIADARVDIEDLEEKLKMEFPEEREYESLGGFLMEVAGEVPSVGWEYIHEKFIFNVTEADLNRVIKVKIKKNTSTDSKTEDSKEINTKSA